MKKREFPYYILNGKEPVGTNDITEWGKCMEGKRHVGNNHIFGIHISTVFLGTDHGWNSDVPILFETMVFGGYYDEYQWRYATWKEAEKGHRKILLKVIHTLPWRLLRMTKD